MTGVGRTIETHDPFTGELVASVPASSRDDVALAVCRARAAQVAWAALPVEERLRRLDRWRAVLYRERRAVAQMVRRETGKPEAEVLAAELATGLDLIRFYVRHTTGLLQPRSHRSSTLALVRKQLTTTFEPWGTVAMVSPWNYPFMLPVGQLAPLLAAGNAVVHKPSELTVGTASLVHAALREAGIPDAVCAIVHGGADVGDALVTGGVDKVFFTGSVRAGRVVAGRCAEHLVPCSLELGGSDPALVLADANLRLAARGIAWGRFANAGQTCVAAKRVFVHASVAAPFLAALREEVGRLRMRTPGDAHWEVGPVIHRAAAAHIEELIRVEGELGATVERPHGATDAPLVSPAILTNVPMGSRSLSEEVFGPVLPVVVTASDDEAVALANASPFGLSASVWSRSRRHARTVATRLRAGTVAINDVALVAGVAEVSHGGVGLSGSGRSHGTAGLFEAVRTRTMVDDVVPWAGQPWWFPYPADRSHAFEQYLGLAHAPSLFGRLRGLWPAIRLFLGR
ncbi:MAG: aldehyde dehydrogenase family protein [Gemmatimonadetes bacterium]|nr:aldehyde dehydrogenase family protein [Gemmatimonadota bacterium]